MKPVQTLLTIVFAISALSLTVWFGRYGASVPLSAPQAAAKKADPAELAVPSSGPFGKAVANESSFDFGSTEMGGSGSHVFIIKNEGPGPLRVKGGTTSCPQCTIGKVSPEDVDIPSGETAEVEIKWKISAPKSKFRQTADVYTTDPQNKKLTFAIQGAIDVPLHASPEGYWLLGDLSSTDPTQAKGLLYSTLVDEIVVERTECSNPLVTITTEPAPPEALILKNARSGLSVKAVVAPGAAVGPFRETVKLHTNVRGGTDVEFTLSGQRAGPLTLAGAGWISQSNVLTLPEFPASEGTKAKLRMYVRDFDGDLEAHQVDPEKSRAKVRVTSSGKVFGKSKVYDLEVEIPPGEPAMRRTRDAELIVLKLNHPSISEFKLYVEYFAK